MKYQFIRDSTKIDKILDIILSNELESKSKLKIIRTCKLIERIYFELDLELTIYFDIYNPSEFALNEMKQEKERNKIK